MEKQEKITQSYQKYPLIEEMFALTGERQVL